MSLFDELKRRNVFKVAVAYVIVGWVILQIADTIAPLMSLPEWAASTVFFFLVVGFPFAVFFSWVFELTPEGVKRQSDIDREVSITVDTGRKIDFIIIGALVLAIGGLLYDRGQIPDQVVTADDVERTSIAVLPFVNMSSDPEQEFFSDGITEEILNALVKIKGLRVTARTSAFAYKGKSPDLREVGKALGVESIVEGSVRKSGTKVRITAQLIDTKDGSHIWSEVYDRELTDIFAIQDEIARAIASTLTISLGLKEGETLVEDRTTSVEAYDQYLRARKIVKERQIQNLSEAIDILKDVVITESNFAPAWAALSLAYNIYPFYFTDFKGKPVDLVQLQYLSEQAARRAVTLNPNLADARHVMANALRWRHQWAEAEVEYLKARNLDPESVGIIEDYSEFLRWVGKLKIGLGIAKEALELEPNSAFPYMSYVQALASVQNHEKAVEELEYVRKNYPDFKALEAQWAISYVELHQYKDAIMALENCSICGTEKSKKDQIEVLNSKIKGDDLSVYNKNFSSYEWVNSIIYFVGGVDLLLKQIEYYDLHTPAYFDISMSLSESFMMNEVRKTDRYKQLVGHVGLVDYWRTNGWPDYCQATSDYDFKCGEIQ